MSGGDDPTGVVDRCWLEHPSPATHGPDRLGAENAPNGHEKRVAATAVETVQPGPASQLGPADDSPLTVQKDLENSGFLGRERGSAREQGVGAGVQVRRP